jgi:hypothetical protein
MRVIVERDVHYHRPGSTLVFSIPQSTHPYLLPHDLRDHIVAIGAGRLVDHSPGQKDGGIAALIERKRRSA